MDLSCPGAPWPPQPQPARADDADCVEAARVAIAALTEVVSAGRVVVTVHGQDILLVCLGATIVAVANTCPHLGARLEGGSVEGGALRCHAHSWRFDLRTGQLQRQWWQRQERALGRARLPTYRVVVQGNTVLLELPRTTGGSAAPSAPSTTTAKPGTR